jgi:spore coat protein SA
LKVGFVSQTWDHSGPPDPGGSIGIWTWEVARRLARSLDVVVAGPRSRGVAAERWENVDFRRPAPAAADRWLPILERVFARTNGPEFASSVYYPFYAKRAAKTLSAERCDVVHVHNFSQWVPVIRSACPQAKIVLHMHADWLIQLDRDQIARRLKLSNVIVGCSDYVTRNIQRRFPEYVERCVTVYNGVDLNSITPGAERLTPSDGPRVVFVGRVSPEKGIHVLIDAFELVLTKCPDAHLEIIGGEYIMPFEYFAWGSDDSMVRGLKRFYPGSYLEALRHKARRNLEGHVTFLGHLPRAEMIEHVRQADLFVQPSIAVEMFGMAVADAMAAAVPVVATRICGLPEVVADGKTGVLVPPNNPEALADAIIRQLSNFTVSKQMGQAGRARVERLFSWDHTAKTIERVYRAICSEESDT